MTNYQPNEKFRLGILVSHPIQYYTPWFRYLAKRMEIEVFYCHRQDARGQAEAGFGVEFDWDVPLLEGYPYRWLKNVARRPGVGSFWGCDTPELYDLIQPDRFDAFLIFGWNYKSAIQAVFACWRNKIPILMRGDSHLGTKRPWLRSVGKQFLYRWFLPRLDGYLYVGKRNKAYLKHYGVPEENLFSSPHFVDNDFFQEGSERAEREGRTLEIRRKLGIPNDAFVFLYVGKLIEVKRPMDFLKACLNVFQKPENFPIHALFVGDGPLRPRLEALAKPYARQIHFVGFKNQTELPAFYRASHCLVLPGEESWGLVVNEAFVCGIPAIVSDAVGCASDLIEGGQTGYTYPVGNVSALARRMLVLRECWESQRSAIRHALAQKIAGYSVEKATEGLEAAIEKVRTLRCS